MNPMLSNLDTAAACRVLIHPNNGIPKIWIAVASAVSKTIAWRVWGSLKRGSLQARESSWNDMVANVMPAKRAKGYVELSAQSRWFEVQQLVAAYLHGKPFLSIEGFRVGQEADGMVPDRDLEIALRKAAPGVLATGGNPFRLVSAEETVVAGSSTRVLGKDDILNGVIESTGRSYAW
jgi:hypothetical protein